MALWPPHPAPLPRPSNGGVTEGVSHAHRVGRVHQGGDLVGVSAPLEAGLRITSSLRSPLAKQESPGMPWCAANSVTDCGTVLWTTRLDCVRSGNAPALTGHLPRLA